MRNVGELVSTVNKYKKAVIQQEFKSKKNTVAYITLEGKPRIIKWFVPGFKKGMNIEFNILKKGSSKLNMPTVFEMDEQNNVLVTSYLIGENLSDIINSDETIYAEKQRLMILLAGWFTEFHNFFKKDNEFMIRGDSSLRNFILTDRIFGVDFEESRKGKPVEDVAGMCASILTTDPMFTPEKFKLCKIFIDAYVTSSPGRIININDEIAYCLLEKIQWRPDDEETLRKYSKRIKKHGIL